MTIREKCVTHLLSCVLEKKTCESCDFMEMIAQHQMKVGVYKKCESILRNDQVNNRIAIA